MIKKIALGLALLIGAFLIYVALQPSEFMVSRQISVAAAPEKIFPYINDAKKMDSWNPWTELDPTAKMSFSGPEAGVGAKTSWQGGEQLGTGSATVIESTPFQVVKTKLEYTEPFVMTQDAQITLTPSGDHTTVQWSVRGHNNFVGRVFCFFMNMDKMVGETFEKGLSKLKSLVEALPADEMK